MRLLILADIDDLHWRNGTGQADIVVALGDTAESLILEAAKAFGDRTILAVKGNHDAPAPFPEGITDLHLTTVQFGGLTFGGFNGSWKYKPRGHFLYEQSEATALIKQMPAVDVFVSHNSPRHIHDKEDETHYGFEALNVYITRHQPRLLLHGHQHVNQETNLGGTRIVGVYGHRIVELAINLPPTP
jgi:Icc-related predicted phosphoesterase